MNQERRIELENEETGHGVTFLTAGAAFGDEQQRWQAFYREPYVVRGRRQSRVLPPEDVSELRIREVVEHFLSTGEVLR